MTTTNNDHTLTRSACNARTHESCCLRTRASSWCGRYHLICNEPLPTEGTLWYWVCSNATAESDMGRPRQELAYKRAAGDSSGGRTPPLECNVACNKATV